jgi:sulfate permease, SulP family
MGQITRLRSDVRVVVLDLSRVPVIDATGLVALETACAQLDSAKTRLIIAGAMPQPAAIFKKAHLSRATFADSVADGFAEAERYVASLSDRPVAPGPPGENDFPSALA